MRILQQGNDKIILTQSTNWFARLCSVVFIMAGLWMLYQLVLIQHEPVAIVAAVVFIGFGYLGLRVSGANMTVTLDKTLGKIFCVSNKNVAEKLISEKETEINPTEIVIAEVGMVSRFTGTFGFVFKDGKRIQYGTGGMNALSRLAYMSKLSNFLGVPVEESYMEMVSSKGYKFRASSFIVSVLVVIIAYFLISYFVNLQH